MFHNSLHCGDMESVARHAAGAEIDPAHADAAQNCREAAHRASLERMQLRQERSAARLSGLGAGKDPAADGGSLLAALVSFLSCRACKDDATDAHEDTVKARYPDDTVFS